MMSRSMASIAWGIRGGVIAIVVGALGMATPSLWAATVTLEAESLPTKTTGGPVTDGWGLWSSGYIEGPASFPATVEYQFQIVARGDYAAGAWPIIDVRIDQNSIGQVSVNSSTWKTVTVKKTVSVGTHQVAIVFINDYYAPPADRNLYVDKVQISPTDITPPTISSVAASTITASSAKVTWTTNEASTSQVEYGPTTGYGQASPLDAALVTSHSVSLSGLSAKTLYHYRARSKDAAGNERIGADATFTTAPPADTIPPTGSVTINGGAAVTKATTTTLTLSATDNSGPVSQMQFSNDGTSYSAAEAYGTTKTWTLASGDGTKTVYAKFKDAAGNWSAAATDTIVLDTTPPAVTAVTASSITTTSATMTWTTNEAASSQVDYGPTTAYGQTTALDTALVTSHSTALASLAAGTLYHYRARSKDAAGNEAFSADATFTTTAADTTPPSGSVTINGGAAGTNTAAVTLTLSASDNAGSVSQMQVSNDGSVYSAAEAYATTKSWTLASGDGTKTVYAKFKDAAGNWSAAVSDTIVLDTTPPKLGFTSPVDGATIVSP